MSVKSQHKITHQQADGLVYVPFLKRFLANTDDVDGSDKVYFPIEAGQLVLGVVARITEVIAGGTPSVTVGDSSTADGFVAAADLTEATLNDTFCSLGSANAYGGGKYYASTDQLVVTYQASATSGELELFLLVAGKEAV